LIAPLCKFKLVEVVGPIYISPLSPDLGKVHIWFAYLSLVFVGGTISAGPNCEEAYYLVGRSEAIKSKSIDMLWIWKVFKIFDKCQSKADILYLHLLQAKPMDAIS
jgi:hypothetical protein